MSLTKRILSCMLLLLLLALVLLNAWHGEQEKRQEKTDFFQRKPAALSWTVCSAGNRDGCFLRA